MAEVAVREEGREQATWEVCRVHEDQEGDGGVAVELEVGLGVGDDEVEAEIDAPEGEEETWVLVLVSVENSMFSIRFARIIKPVIDPE